MLTWLYCVLVRGHRYSGWSTLSGSVPWMRVCARCGHRDSPYEWDR